MPQITRTDVVDHIDFLRASQYHSIYARAIEREDDIAKIHFNKTDFVTALRGNLPRSVLNGSVTFQDLLSSDLRLNQHYSQEKIKSVFHGTKEELREVAFPRKQLCEYMGITEETYREIDVSNKRRDSFVLLQTLFKNASKWKIWNKVPHMLLIEELVNTLNTECLGNFLYDAAIVAIERDANVKEVPWITRNTFPKEKRLFVSCTNPNRITVRAEFSLYPWDNLGAKMRVEYDVAVVEDRLVSYQDIYPTITFSTTHKEYTGWKRDELLALSRKLTGKPKNTPPHPEKYKKFFGCLSMDDGNLIVLGMEGKTFTAQSMLSPTPQEAYQVGDKKGFFEGVRRFFSTICKGLREIFHTIKRILFGHGTTTEEPYVENSSVLDATSKTEDSSTTGESKLHSKHTTSPQEHKAQQQTSVADLGSTEDVDQPCATIASATVSKVSSSNVASAR